MRVRNALETNSSLKLPTHGERLFMITLSFNSDKGAKNAHRGTREQEIRDIVDTHLSFPGSDKLKLGVTLKNNGDASVSFTGPQEALAEVRRLWHEKVQPVAAKVKRAANKLRRAATRAAKPVKRKSAKKSKPNTVKKTAKQVVARAKAKVTRKTSKKRK
jgi:hypothetical protein